MPLYSRSTYTNDNRNNRKANTENWLLQDLQAGSGSNIQATCFHISNKINQAACRKIEERIKNHYPLNEELLGDLKEIRN